MVETVGKIARLIAARAALASVMAKQVERSEQGEGRGACCKPEDERGHARVTGQSR